MAEDRITDIDEDLFKLEPQLLERLRLDEPRIERVKRAIKKAKTAGILDPETERRFNKVLQDRSNIIAVYGTGSTN
ncbi:MAG: hypothetical protein V3U19_03735 [Thermodesulfobacteriota bacterium]